VTCCWAYRLQTAGNGPAGAVPGMVRALHTPLGIQPQGAMLVDLDLNLVGQTGDAELE
jgi:hypothetical protein